MKNLILAFVVLVCVNAQTPDNKWCNISVVDDREFDLPKFEKYQALIERNDLVKKSTEELREWFDSVNNLGIAEQFLEGTKLKTYSYYNLNELLVITDDYECKTYDLDKGELLTPFFSTKYPNGTVRITSPLAHVLQNSARLSYVGSNIVRGLPVNVFQSCVYSDAKKSTIKYSISVLDSTKWVPSDGKPQKVPVELRVTTKKDSDNSIDDDVLSVHEFRPYLLLEEEGYFPAPGFYCPARKSLKEFPSVPRLFSFMMESPQSGLTGGIQGIITKTKEAYDFDARLFKMQTMIQNQTKTEIHDFQTGLVYSIDDASGNCTITTIDPAGIDATSDDGITNIRNPEQFFDVDGVDYQYNGPRKMNGVNADTWIGSKFFKGFNSTFEWAFLTSSWNRTDDLNRYAPTPVRLTITLYVPGGNGFIRLPVIYNFHNFRVSDHIAAHHDISHCHTEHFINHGDHLHFHNHGWHPKKTFQISFETTTDLVELIMKNRELFKLEAYKACQKTAHVTDLRLQDFEVTFDENHVFFIFAVMEKARFYGNVRVPLNDVSLEDAEFFLRNAVQTKQLVVPFQLQNDKFINEKYLLTANPDSFLEIGDPEDTYVVLKTVSHPQGYTTATVAIVSIIMGIIGLLIIVTLLVLHKNKKINLPGLSIN